MIDPWLRRKLIPLIHLSPLRLHLPNSEVSQQVPSEVIVFVALRGYMRACVRVQSGHVSSVSFPSVLPHALKGPRFVLHLVYLATVFLVMSIARPPFPALFPYFLLFHLFLCRFRDVRYMSLYREPPGPASP